MKTLSTIARSFGIIAGLTATLTGVGAARAQAVPTLITMGCGYTITAPGSYALAADIGPCSTSNGINVATSNVVLSLNGHTITGSNNNNGTGINICVQNNEICSPARLNNVNIQGPGQLRNFSNGIYLRNVDNSVIQNTVVAFNSLGLITNGATNLLLKANVAVMNGGDGIHIENDTNDNVQGNIVVGDSTVSTGDSGIAVVNGSGNEVSNNDINTNSCHGIWISSANNNIHQNSVFGNGNTNGQNCLGAGIIVWSGAAGNHIHNNTTGGNQIYDLVDVNPSCGSNTWKNDTFSTTYQACDQ